MTTRLSWVVWSLAGALAIAAGCAEGTEPDASSGAEPGATVGSASTGGGGASASGPSTGGAGTGGGASSGEAGSGASGMAGAGGGAAGAGGQAGAGGGGQGGAGGDPCAVSSSDDACDTCRKPACCAELTVCAPEALCVCWVECIDQYTNDPNKTIVCSGICGDPGASLNAINGVFNCQQSCASCPPVPWA